MTQTACVRRSRADGSSARVAGAQAGSSRRGSEPGGSDDWAWPIHAVAVPLAGLPRFHYLACGGGVQGGLIVTEGKQASAEMVLVFFTYDRDGQGRRVAAGQGGVGAGVCRNRGERWCRCQGAATDSHAEKTN